MIKFTTTITILNGVSYVERPHAYLKLVRLGYLSNEITITYNSKTRLYDYYAIKQGV